MNTALLITSFISGILTVLAPCVLPLLPIIIGGSVGSKGKYKPYIIIASLAVSLVLFTILLKASTLLIDIDPSFWKYISGGLVSIFGLIYLFPDVWTQISVRLGFSKNSDQLLEKASEKDGILGAVLLGGALGPVFASCSPTYSLIIATILPVNFFEGLIYIVVYILGLSLVMLGIALLGRKLTKKLTKVADPKSWFKKTLGILFLIVGISIITGFDKKVEAAILDSGYFDITKTEQSILEKNMKVSNESPIIINDSNPELNVPIGKKAPEIKGIESWINSNGETLANLKGKVVLIDFWTYSCINCQRTLPFVTKWYDTYKDQGFVVLGIHAPEFSFEKNKENVQKFVTENKINYPVGLDNNFSTWKAYDNQFWPAGYLIDKEGNIRRTHFGEGKYDETEKAIRTLLAQNGSKISQPLVTDNLQAVQSSNKYCDIKGKCFDTTPETYLNSSRGERFENAREFEGNKNTTFTQITPKPNYWSLSGQWTIEENQTISNADTNSLELAFNAKEVYLVMGSTDGAEKQVQVEVNGQKINLGNDVNNNGVITVKDSTLYKLVKSPEFMVNGKLKVTIPKGVHINAFTFG
jgi:cytochrome c biogenesis protein CcdA/thiol-disulfide isomerase/thioredoxin